MIYGDNRCHTSTGRWDGVGREVGEGGGGWKVIKPWTLERDLGLGSEVTLR